VLSRAIVPAPAGLRSRIEVMRSPAARPARRRGLMAGGFAVAAAAVLLIVALVVLPGGAGGPTVAQAAELARLPATQPAPGVSAGDPARLDAAVDGVAFPAWVKEFGWEAVGARSDEIGGRAATTVFYEKEGRRLAYTIVGGEALEVPDGTTVTVKGVGFTAIDQGVTWRRDGHTCVLTGAGVPPDRVLDLAGWRGAGALTF